MDFVMQVAIAARVENLPPSLIQKVGGGALVAEWDKALMRH